VKFCRFGRVARRSSRMIESTGDRRLARADRLRGGDDHRDRNLGLDLDERGDDGGDGFGKLDRTLGMDTRGGIHGLVTDGAAFAITVQDRPVTITGVRRHHCCSCEE
jgi:hypothetical protein